MAGPKGSKYYNIYLDFSIYLKHREDGNPVLTEEHFELLLNIGELGSLAATAERMQISYRKAWGLLRQSEQTLGFPLLEKHRGGRDGGNTLLTEEGKNLVESYKALRVEFDSSVKVFVKNFFHRINEQ
ncbi:MAG TPA: LysR family transcriptional regulator [Tenuifilaceae bacterium]|nr:LysR family transcriptional regulator [Tenuifilaceae bacterium]HPI44885.1 LysR family transcriptional regulator [Tenuifilaceae bacterium]HPN23073.1 LysR family transcriptional regulator [Tenuifilaceae bacterium]